MNAFFRGLNLLRLGDLIIAQPEKFHSLFVYEENILTVDTFLNLVSSQKPLLQKQAQSYNFFMEYVHQLEGACML